MHGIRAAHWAALQAGIQLLGGPSHAGLPLVHVLSDLYSITSSDLLTYASLAAMYSELIARLAPTLFQVRPPRA